jgi:hypothetical protein
VGSPTYLKVMPPAIAQLHIEDSTHKPQKLKQTGHLPLDGVNALHFPSQTAGGTQRQHKS